jgi:glutathione synthase/RimK-type ligase-like ATP-grasp enzyme
VIEQDGRHFDALVALGNLLNRTGYRNAARLSYLEAAKARESALVYVNLGNTYLDTNDNELAEAHFERALELDATQPEAHQGLSYVFARMGDEEGAARHRDAGFRDRAVTAFPYRGSGTPIQAVLLVSALGGNVATGEFLDDRLYATTRIFVDYYRETKLPRADLTFNAIGDADRCADTLARAASLLLGGSSPVINAPQFVQRTGRVAVSERAAGIANLVAPKTLSISKAEIAARPPFAFPFLVRAPGFHTGMYFSLVRDEEELASALGALPGENVMAIEFLDARGEDGNYRKYRVMIVDGELYPLHLGIASDWKVHYFTSDMLADMEYRSEEQRFLSDMDGAIGARAVEALRELAQRLGLEYAGVDFGIDRERNVLLFEANATMVVPSREANPDLAYRLPYQERVIAAVREMLTRSAGSTRS